MDRQVKMFQTRYALTQGILEVNSELVEERDGSEPQYARHGASGFDRIGKDIHFTLEQARAKAEKMRLSRIAALKKAIKKLEILAFVFLCLLTVGCDISMQATSVPVAAEPPAPLRMQVFVMNQFRTWETVQQVLVVRDTLTGQEWLAVTGCGITPLTQLPAEAK